METPESKLYFKIIELIHPEWNSNFSAPCNHRSEKPFVFPDSLVQERNEISASQLTSKKNGIKRKKNVFVRDGEQERMALLIQKLVLT